MTLAGRTLLSIAETNAALGELAAIYVAPLLAHDAAHGTALAPSLRVYLDAHGQWRRQPASSASTAIPFARGSRRCGNWWASTLIPHGAR